MFHGWIDVDVVIVGGGVTGLWTLDELRRSGYKAVLLENQALGSGQTIASQGIIHGGTKYSLKGALTASSQEIREMPAIWRQCLSGQQQPNLSRTIIRNHYCYLWQSQGLSSQAGMLGAQLNLNVKPIELKEHQRPEVLRQTKGHVYRLDEQVISPSTLIDCFRNQLNPYLLKIDESKGLEFGFDKQGQVSFAVISCQGQELTISCKAVVYAAGAGNQALSQQTGKAAAMQRRPLHMVLVRGSLPNFQGHCIDAAKTRLTITSEYITRSECVWQLGGYLAELGVKRTEHELVRHAAKELQATLPGFEVDQLLFSTYKSERAEKKTALGLRPSSPQIIQHLNTWTCWPTKLAFAPKVAESISAAIKSQLSSPADVHDWLPEELNDWPKPTVAQPPWETVSRWYRADGELAEETPASLDKAG